MPAHRSPHLHERPACLLYEVAHTLAQQRQPAVHALEQVVQPGQVLVAVGAQQGHQATVLHLHQDLRRRRAGRAGARSGYEKRALYTADTI